MIRVIRILEYTYETPERMEKDMGAWAMGINAVRSTGMNGMTIRSATLPAQTVSYSDTGAYALDKVLERAGIPGAADGILEGLADLGFEIVRRLP